MTAILSIGFILAAAVAFFVYANRKARNSLEACGIGPTSPGKTVLFEETPSMAYIGNVGHEGTLTVKGYDDGVGLVFLFSSKKEELFLPLERLQPNQGISFPLKLICKNGDLKLSLGDGATDLVRKKS